MDSVMRRMLISVNTCNTHNFGIQDPPRDTLYVKGYCLTANGYPTSDGLTHRTYIMEIEDEESELRDAPTRPSRKG